MSNQKPVDRPPECAAKPPPMPDLIVSVESRKGGVGKTTIAISLSRLLLKDYAVLFLDLDITGTNAADIVASPYWQDELTTVKVAEKDDADLIKTEDANLLKLFDSQFMTGKGILPFHGSEAVYPHATIDCKRVNVFGSQLYEWNLDKNAHCILSPDILFDEIHCFWLLHFIKGIVESFAEAARGLHPTKPVAVVLDNSPGVVGFARHLAEWLTDLGPQIAKCLTVTSLEAQDLKACAASLSAFETMFKEKSSVSRQFRAAMAAEKSTQVNVSSAQESFFFRLISEERLGTAGELAFYRTQDDRVELYGNHAERYLAAIANRVPQSIFDGQLDYAVTGPNASAGRLLWRLLGGQSARKWQNRMIPYDPCLTLQFLAPNMPARSLSVDDRSSRHLKSLKGSVAWLSRLADEWDKLNSFGHEVPGTPWRIYRAIVESVSHAVSQLRDLGIPHLLDVNPQWLPSSVLTQFQTACRRLLEGEEVLPAGSLDHPMIPSEDEDLRAAIELQHALIKQSRASGGALGSVDVLKRREMQLSSSLAMLIRATLAPWHLKERELIVELFGLVLRLEEQVISRSIKAGGSEGRLAGALLRVRVNSAEMQAALSTHGGSIMKLFWPELKMSFAEFVQACLTAQARWLDLGQDALFLVRAIRAGVEMELGRRKTPRRVPYLGQVIVPVVVAKTKRHSRKWDELAEELDRARYHSEISAVLDLVLRQWADRDPRE